jgi:mono/diheme cytochrome c family protein
VADAATHHGCAALQAERAIRILKHKPGRGRRGSRGRRGAAAVAALLIATAALAAQRRSVWDGVFTAPQAARGAESYQYSCATCHSPDLEGDAGRDVPALYGEAFVGSWNGRTIKDLFDLIKKAMPKDSPGSLKAETYADVVAFLLQANEFPAGAQELPIDLAALERIRMGR